MSEGTGLTRDVFELGDQRLESDALLRRGRLSYTTYGTLNADRSNAVLFPMAFAGRSQEVSWLVGPGRLLDPATYFVMVPELRGKSLSSSLSNTPPPYDRGCPEVPRNSGNHRLSNILGLSSAPHCGPS